MKQKSESSGVVYSTNQQNIKSTNPNRQDRNRTLCSSAIQVVNSKWQLNR